MMRTRSLAVLLPDLRPGGAERVVLNIVNDMAARGHPVDLVLLQEQGELLDLVDARVKVVSLGADRIRHAFWPLVKYLRRARPASFLANMWPLTAAAIVARRLAATETRMVVAEHTTWSQSELLVHPSAGWSIRQSMHHLFPRADAIVTVSNGAADDLARFARLPRASIHVVYNPVVEPGPAVATSLPTEPSGWCSGTHRKILAVGTLKAIKAYDVLLQAFATLRQQVDARLLILGEGECREALEAQAERLGIAGQVFMPGFVRDTGPYYRHADLQVLTSTGEGLPTVIIESLASGTPVVSTDCPSGPREILADGEYGRLVPVGDAQALAAAMAESLRSTTDGAALIRRSRDFTIDKAVDRYEALLFPESIGEGLS